MASNAIIQYNPSSSHVVIKTYDVFVSFCGEDTRNNFTGFLFQALCSKGIDAFKDDKDLKKGESIAPELLQAIQESRIFVVIFSKNYASSTWCLRELAEICNCIEISPRSVLPIFYDVDPSEVRKQSGCYEKAFAQHEERFREDKEKMEEVQRWRKALIHVANLSGWDIRNKPQHAEIEQIVQTILNSLGPIFSSLLNDDLVGIQSRVKELTKLLCLESHKNVRVVGISGMGGIGKSTLARALYERISHQYKFGCFIDDVSKVYRDSSTLGVQKQLLCQCLNDKSLEICTVSEGKNLMLTRLRSRALVVFDNVDQVGQLKMFIGSNNSLLHKCLVEGSRIIIISRDEHVLRTHGVDDIYQVQPLNDKDATKLFCMNAFKCNDLLSGYQEFTDVILSYTRGHPLAIEVVGSYLFGRTISQWRSALAKLRKHKIPNIRNMLRICFDELDNIDKEIFLDIACFLNKYDEQHVKEILNFRGFHPEDGLQVLIDKSLITIQCGKIHMHGLLVDMGRSIVREKSPKEPGNWSRLWEYKDLHKIMSTDKTAENLEVIVLERFRSRNGETTLRADTFSKMSNLKLLAVDHVDFSGSLNYLSNELGYLRWIGYPFECLPPSFQPYKLVELLLMNSNIKQLWKDTKPLHSLRRLDLSHSENLIEMPDLGKALNLEWLNLKGCIKIKKIDQSIGLLRKLNFVNLEDCINLVKLPHFRETQNLETLNLRGCIVLEQIHPSIGLQRKLTFLNLKNCISLIRLPHFKEDLNLETLNLERCIRLKKINSSIGRLRKLTFLNLRNCKSLVSLPNSILGLNSLEYLNLSGCTKLLGNQLIKELREVEHLKRLHIGEDPTRFNSTMSIMKRWLYSRAHKDSFKCLLPFVPTTFPCMRALDLSFCNLVQIPDAIGSLNCLERLNLMGNNFAALPSLKGLSKLYHLDLQHCKQLNYLPELSSQIDLPLETYTPSWPRIESLVLASVSRSSIITPPVIIIEAGLKIFNCPKLVENARERCTSMTISWMLQILQAQFCIRPWYLPTHPQVSSIIPGSEIPRWFNNQHVCKGNLLFPNTLENDYNCIGIMCCVVFRAQNRREIVSSMSPPRKRRYYGITIAVVLDDEYLVTDKSYHMWLVYLDPDHFTGSWGSLLEFEITMMIKKGFDFELKKWGYRWISKEDIESSNLTIMMDSGNSSAVNKFSEIEEENKRYH